MSDTLPNDVGAIPPLPTFPHRNSGTTTPNQRNAPHFFFKTHNQQQQHNQHSQHSQHKAGNETPSPHASATSSRRSSLTAAFSQLQPPNTHSKPGTPLSHARSILKPDEGSPSRTPQLSHGSLLKHEHTLPTGELIAGPSGPLNAALHHRRKSSSAATVHVNSALLTVDDPNRPPPTLLGRRNSKLIPMCGTNFQFKHFLSKHTVADLDLIGKQRVIEINGSLSPAEGFEILLKANILSAPVIDPHYSQHNNSVSSRYTGFLDVRDLVSSLVYAHEEEKLQNAWTESFMDLSINNKFSNIATTETLTTHNVTLTYLSRRNPFRPVLSTDSLLTVAKAMSNQLHRVPVVDSTGQCVAIISQSTLVNYLMEHKQEMEVEMKQSLQTLSLGVCRVISCTADTPAWNAFKLLETSGVSGIAVVEKEGGKLVGNTSARDLKLFVLDRGNLSLDVPIIDYLSQIRQREATDYERHPSCSVSQTASIGHVIGLMNATKYHRVFIVDSQGKPIGVLSVTDVLRYACADQIAPTTVTIPLNAADRRRSASISSASTLMITPVGEK